MIRLHVFDSCDFQQRFASLTRELRSFKDVQQMKGSPWYRENRELLDSLLLRPYRENPFEQNLSRGPWIRCVSWNIEKGKNLDALIQVFQKDARLKKTDILFLQEADLGMVRSQNRFVARDLARALRMNFAYAPCFIELTKGVDADLRAAGENSSGLQGNALLSRFSIQSASIVELPQCFEPFEFVEKRLGHRNALVCGLQVGSRTLTAVSTHLEVRNSPDCRARQMKTVVNSLQQYSHDPILIGGDFNSNTFARGTVWRALRGLMRVVRMAPPLLMESTLSPFVLEPLFQVLRRGGFEWGVFNDRQMTSRASLRSLEDIRFIPWFLKGRVDQALKTFEDGLPLRLDWFAGKSLSASTTDIPGGGDIPSRAVTIDRFEDGQVPEKISDHRPILVDVRF